ncbi:agmatine deiminase family protein [Ktedonosporobacter rubrisoli]|uniref:Agmatine deiminase family protein n=1 Tax=Ktedonosporobacter rubrisoli TaxID=2509675 RepID=A0A4P6K5T1_KTERU|nr:agmatine deiminase family protein [Ktedonosporobacter rubrisoli]QBD83240.1 agmatine deiminase family protein [Ktedonosporobacter rubrisoli]
MQKFRTVGEFERQESVLLIWPLEPFATSKLSVDAVSIQVVQALINEVEVIICCADVQIQQRAVLALSQHGVDVADIRFVLFPAEIPYPRDFGAEVMVGERGERMRVDFRFDMYGYLSEDDELSRLLRGFGDFHAKLVGIEKTLSSALISEGGDREFNGKGTMMAVRETEVDKRNPDKTFAEVDEEFKRIFSLDQIIWLPRGSYDDEYSYSGPIPSADGTFRSYRSASANGHIDEICRFTDESTIVIAQVSEEEAAVSKLHALNKERLDQAYETIQAARTQEGKAFRILKMPMPEPIYLNLYPEDDAFVSWGETREHMGGFLMDGTPFPEAPVNVLPAMSYCNFLIANDIVVAQKYYEEGLPEKIKEKDEAALQVLQTAFPKRRIVQINALALNLYGGGIHCHTRNIPAIQNS